MKIGWFLEKQFDVAHDIATWVEMIKVLQVDSDVFLVTGYRSKKIQIDGLKNKIIYIKMPYIPFLKRVVFYYRQVRIFKNIIRKRRPDVLLFNTQNYFLLKKAIRLQRKFKYRSFLDIRTLPVYSSIIINGIEEFMFKKCMKTASADFDGVSYITEEMKRYCQEKYFLPEHKTKIWSSGVDVDIFKPSKVTVERKSLCLIYHGSITENRQLDSVIKACKLLKDIRIELILLGSGNGIEQLKRLTARLKLEKKVFFYPPVVYNKVPEYINRADAGILPFGSFSRWSTSSPIKLFEYLACGKPVIVTRIPAHINVLEGKEFAFWAYSSAPKEIAKAIKKAYAKKHRFNKIGKQARQFVNNYFTWKIQAEKILRFISN